MMKSLKKSIKGSIKTAINIILFLSYWVGLPILYYEICKWVFGDSAFAKIIAMIGVVIIFEGAVVEYVTRPFKIPPGGPHGDIYIDIIISKHL